MKKLSDYGFMSLAKGMIINEIGNGFKIRYIIIDYSYIDINCIDLNGIGNKTRPVITINYSDFDKYCVE